MADTGRYNIHVVESKGFPTADSEGVSAGGGGGGGGGGGEAGGSVAHPVT